MSAFNDGEAGNAPVGEAKAVVIEGPQSLAPDAATTESLAASVSGSSSPTATAAVGEDATRDRSNTNTAKPATRAIDPSKLLPSDFYFGKCLGEGAYARVVHARAKNTDAQFAIKIMEKRHIKKENKIKYVMTERNILSRLNHPFIIKLYYTFQDPNYLYLCMEIAKGGELLRLINKLNGENEAKGIENVAFSEPMARFYAAEIVESLRYLHESGVFHRDLKPENILITESGHIKLADFGTALVDAEAGSSPEDLSRNSFVGTAEYVSPEVLGDEDATKACDLWALGCILYQMLSGRSPFRAASEYLIFNKILAHCDGSEPLDFPDSIGSEAKALIQGLLIGDVLQRFGAGPPDSSNSFDALVSHPFFTSASPAVIASMDLCKETPPFVPDSSTFPPLDIMIDGASDEWLTEGDATPITSEHKPKHLSHGDADLSRISEDSASVAAESVKDTKKAYFWDALLKPGEEQVFSGIVWKRKGLFSKRRHLLLTNLPRLLYFDPETEELKGEIPWSDEHPVKCIPINDANFDILAQRTGRRYHINDSSAGSAMWIDLINAVLEQQSDKIKQTSATLSVDKTRESSGSIDNSNTIF